MNTHPVSLFEAIRRHKEAVLIDEASFNENCEPIDIDLAAATGAAEIEAFKALAAAPCRTPEDVQSKIEYMVNGTIGLREPLMSCLSADQYGGFELLDVFLSSLLVDDGVEVSS